MDFCMILPAIRIHLVRLIDWPTRSHNSTLDGSFTLSASHSTILVCLFMRNGSHTHTVGRFITAILLECDDFFTILRAIRTSCKAYCCPLEAIIGHWMVHSLSLPVIASYWCVYWCKWQPYSHSGTFYNSNTPRIWWFLHDSTSHKDIL